MGRFSRRDVRSMLVSRHHIGRYEDRLLDDAEVRESDSEIRNAILTG
jgi:hypothetical protein